jgi:hypothetical protein
VSDSFVFPLLEVEEATASHPTSARNTMKLTKHLSHCQPLSSRFYVERTGFEPVPAGVKTRYPRPLDERSIKNPKILVVTEGFEPTLSRS